MDYCKHKTICQSLDFEEVDMRFNHNQEIPTKKDSNKDKAGVDRIYVDMHCHSLFSDGSLSPEQIARELSSDNGPIIITGSFTVVGEAFVYLGQ